MLSKIHGDVSYSIDPPLLEKRNLIIVYTQENVRLGMVYEHFKTYAVVDDVSHLASLFRSCADQCRHR